MLIFLGESAHRITIDEFSSVILPEYVSVWFDLSDFKASHIQGAPGTKEEVGRCHQERAKPATSTFCIHVVVLAWLFFIL